MGSSPPPPSGELIAAIATPPGKGGIGIIRMSGTGLAAAAHQVVDAPVPIGRTCVRRFLDAAGAEIDSGLALRFAAPHSYTGEDTLELHGHGGPAVMRALLRRCLEVGARLAEPGEFTRRAFTNGKLDLAQAEAVADLIDATSERAARLATASLRGALGERAGGIATRLTEARAQLEAAIDFADEELDTASHATLTASLDELNGDLARLHEDCARGARWRAGATVALVGAPNAGKSSLLNALGMADAAIVDAAPGTTRDVVSVTCELGGMEVRLLDTAGQRDAGGAVEREGMRRARAAAATADLVVEVIDATAAGPGLDAGLRVHNKIDLTGDTPRVDADGVWVSATTGAGLDLLRTELGARCAGSGAEPPFLARERHVAALAAARAAVAQARTEDVALPERRAEWLRAAQVELGRLTGAVTADDLLGEIFARFCIGK